MKFLIFTIIFSTIYLFIDDASAKDLRPMAQTEIHLANEEEDFESQIEVINTHDGRHNPIGPVSSALVHLIDVDSNPIDVRRAVRKIKNKSGGKKDKKEKEKEKDKKEKEKEKEKDKGKGKDDDSDEKETVDQSEASRGHGGVDTEVFSPF